MTKCTVVKPDHNEFIYKNDISYYVDYSKIDYYTYHIHYKPNAKNMKDYFSCDEEKKNLKPKINQIFIEF